MPQLLSLRSLPFQETPFSPNLPFRIPPPISSSRNPPSSRRVPRTLSKPPKPHAYPNLRWLTCRIVDLTRRRQLNQIFEEVEVAKERYGKLNTIVMNAVMEACVHCGDVDSALRMFVEMSKPAGCGVDTVSYGILLKVPFMLFLFYLLHDVRHLTILDEEKEETFGTYFGLHELKLIVLTDPIGFKGLGEARRVDEAFEILESIELGTATGNPRLSPQLIYGLLNALLEAGDMRRANALVARSRHVLCEEGDSVLLYNLLMKGYINTNFPLGALTVRDEILRQGLKPDKLTYNTLVSACVRSGDMDKAIQLLAEMKEEAEKSNCYELFPDAITYTSLLKGLANCRDLLSVLKIVVEMKTLLLSIDRIAYTAMIDALLACGSMKGALCIFGEIVKKAGMNNNLRPKPHLYFSMMRAFAISGDFEMAKRLHLRMWSDSVGSIPALAQAEADELLMEAAVNSYQVDVARDLLSNIINKQEFFSWTSRGGMVAVRVEVLSGFTNSMLRPCVLPQISVNDPVEKYMTPFEEANPLPANLKLNKVIMRFFKDPAIPIVDDWGSCVGIVHRCDCSELNSPLSTLMRGPPPCVTISTSVGRVIDLLLEKKYELVIVVRNSNMYESSYSSSSRPLGVFSLQKFKFALGVSEMQDAHCSSISTQQKVELYS